MKTLTNDEIIFLLDHCAGSNHCEDCPLVAECLYYYIGEKNGSVLEENT
jgi:hypothetical protein